MKIAIYKFLLISGILFWPTISLALANPNLIAPNVTSTAKSNFCAKLSTTSQKITGRITEKETKIEQTQATRRSKLDSKRSERKQKLDELRASWDDKREARYLQLEDLAKNDEQQAAVEEFKTTVEEAVKTRRAAIDVAIAEFRKDVDAVIANRQSSIDSATTNYRNSVQTALAKAQAGCGGETDPSVVRTELKNNLLTARTTLKTERTNIDKISDNIGTYVTTRKVAFNAAWSAFRETFSAAQEELKKDFE